MAYQFSRKGCFKCGNLGHIAENCSSEQRLCYNCRQPGHESSACPSPRSVSAKQCYSCGGVGHIQAECPSLRIQQGNNQKTVVALATLLELARMELEVPLPPGLLLPVVLSTLRLCPLSNAIAVGGLIIWLESCRDCLAAPGTSVGDAPTGPSAMNKTKTCYKCQQEGHIARDCPENAEFAQ
ncbi:hypothetical protein GYMLUDRAFT_239846 [Collybiopsis luxurians FD-317 M1]|nr:hypothetical protein GYMLUDRAFT_239846 [Collybiopsis luxurians FD-317 M1]